MQLPVGRELLRLGAATCRKTSLPIQSECWWKNSSSAWKRSRMPLV